MLLGFKISFIAVSERKLRAEKPRAGCPDGRSLSPVTARKRSRGAQRRAHPFFRVVLGRTVSDTVVFGWRLASLSVTNRPVSADRCRLLLLKVITSFQDSVLARASNASEVWHREMVVPGSPELVAYAA